MSCWSKEELENMLEDVVNELDLSDDMTVEQGQQGTAPAELVRLVLKQKDRAISRLRKLVKQARDEYIEENFDGEHDCVTPYDIYKGLR